MGQDKAERRQQARGILEQFKASGLSQREFAEREGVSASTLAYWLRRERLEAEIQGETALVAVSSPSPSEAGFVLEIGEVRIELPRDTSVEEWCRLREGWAS